MGAEFRCPNCGFGPLREDAEDCPKCKEHFAANPLFGRVRRAGGFGQRKDEADMEATRTTLGSITGAVDAHPYPTAAVLMGCAFTWIARCLGVLSDKPQSLWPIGIAAIQMGAAMLLIVSAGPARQLAQMLAVAQIAAGWFAGGTPVAQVGYMGVGVSLLLMTVAEPGDARRWLGTGAAVAMLGFGVWGVVAG